MRAIQIENYGGPEVLQIREAELPSFETDEVLVKVTSTSVNFADIMTRRGEYHAAGSPPLIPGLEAVGVIVQTGDHPEHLTAGTNVMVLPKTGSYAEYVIADRRLVFPIPSGSVAKRFEGAAVVALTSYMLLMEVANLKKGDTVLIHSATGGIGTTAIQIAKYYGAKKIIGTTSREDKLQTILDSGADEAFLYTDPELAGLVMDSTGGRGADIILDPISGNHAERALGCLAPFGRLVLFGKASKETATFNSDQIYTSSRSIRGFSLGTAKAVYPELIQKVAPEVVRLLADGEIEIKIGKRFPLTEAAAAHEWLESRQNTGKIILDVSSK